MYISNPVSIHSVVRLYSRLHSTGANSAMLAEVVGKAETIVIECSSFVTCSTVPTGVLAATCNVMLRSGVDQQANNG